MPSSDRRLNERQSRIVFWENYLRRRLGTYEQREQRYKAASAALVSLGLNEDHLLIDVGAGWTEFDFHLRTYRGWRGRYWPVDGSFSGIDVEDWLPGRKADFFVLLEVLEHLHQPGRLIWRLKRFTYRGIVISVPNPATTDVLGMDETHRTAITAAELSAWGFRVSKHSFYGHKEDTLLGVWKPPGPSPV